MSKIAALCNVYHDDVWLPLAYRSAYDSVDAFYFFINSHPWSNLEKLDNSSTRRCIAELPDPDNKRRVIFDQWPDEIAQRNYTIDRTLADGFTWGMIVDADEIYEKQQLDDMITLVRANPQISCWHIRWYTYWKSYQYRIDPPEPYEPPVFLKLGTCRFVETRNPLGPSHLLIDPNIGMCHHMSYARTDEEVRRKISMFSHSHQILTGWYENVWKAWDNNKSLMNLHPVLPDMYKRAIEQPREALPTVLKEWLKASGR